MHVTIRGDVLICKEVLATSLQLLAGAGLTLFVSLLPMVLSSIFRTFFVLKAGLTEGCYLCGAFESCSFLGSVLLNQHLSVNAAFSLLAGKR